MPCYAKCFWWFCGWSSNSGQLCAGFGHMLSQVPVESELFYHSQMDPRIRSTTWRVQRPQCTTSGIQLKPPRPGCRLRPGEFHDTWTGQGKIGKMMCPHDVTCEVYLVLEGSPILEGHSFENVLFSLPWGFWLFWEKSECWSARHSFLVKAFTLSSRLQTLTFWCFCSLYAAIWCDIVNLECIYSIL